MVISATTNYALRALLIIADRDGQPVRADAMAREGRLPAKFIQIVLNDLRRAEIVHSRRGTLGGYTLARPANQITVGEVFRAVNGPILEIRGLTDEAIPATTLQSSLTATWNTIASRVSETLDSITLEHIRNGALPDGT